MLSVCFVVCVFVSVSVFMCVCVSGGFCVAMYVFVLFCMYLCVVSVLSVLSVLMIGILCSGVLRCLCVI